MSNYICWYGKKKGTFVRREQDLMRAIKRGASQGTLIETAKKLRDAKLRALTAERARVSPSAGHEEEYGRIDSEITAWTSLPVQEILSEYRKKSEPRTGEAGTNE